METHQETPINWEVWRKLPYAEKERLRDLSCLSPQLIGLEGWRVEVVRTYTTGEPNEKDRFIVGRSTGQQPIHLEIKTRRSHGGLPAEKTYKTVKPLLKVK